MYYDELLLKSAKNFFIKKIYYNTYLKCCNMVSEITKDVVDLIITEYG